MTTEGRNQRRGFTLVELLVVVSIIGLLVAILLPGLRRARDQAKLTACASNLRQIGTGLHLYANENNNYLPRGSESVGEFDFGGDDLATNQLWLGDGTTGTSFFHPHEFLGLGRLFESTVPQERLYFCPADDNFNLVEELPKIRSDADAYGSYLYRQRDFLPASNSDGRLDQLGVNEVGEVSVRVQLLALDTNTLGAGPTRHTNHRRRDVNLLYRDASVQRLPNVDDVLSVTADAFEGFDPHRIRLGIDQLLVNGDFSYRGSPSEAPRIEP